MESTGARNRDKPELIDEELITKGAQKRPHLVVSAAVVKSFPAENSQSA